MFSAICEKVVILQTDLRFWNSMKKVAMKRTVTIIILLAIAIIALGLAVTLQGKTLVEWWKPAAVCAVPAVAAGILSANVVGRLMRWNKRWLNASAMSILSFSLILGAFYTINFHMADDSSSTTCDVVVVNKFTQERYYTKRQGRRNVRGEKYNVYSVVIKLPDESTKKLSVAVGQYVRTRIGQKFKIEINNGFFGLPVIKEIKFPNGKRQVKKRNNKPYKQNSKQI